MGFGFEEKVMTRCSQTREISPVPLTTDLSCTNTCDDCVLEKTFWRTRCQTYIGLALT